MPINKPDVLEALRLTPGANIQQTGGRGGTTSIFLRGGNSNFTKVLIDGVSANDIGGGVDLAQLQTAGVGRIEMLRQSNSVIYGSDALTGVVNIETTRGRTRVTRVHYTLDGGNFGTINNDIGVGGAVKRSTTSPTTRTSTPTTRCRTTATATTPTRAAFGVALGRGTDLSGTHPSHRRALRQPERDRPVSDCRRFDAANKLTFGSLTASSQWTEPRAEQRAVRRVRASGRNYLNPTATGTYVDSVRLRRQLHGQRGDDHGRQRLQRDGARHSRLRLQPVPVHLFQPDDPQDPVRTVDGAAGVQHPGDRRRPLRT
jgi:outer membrane receptor protein involved in Fe transport